MDKIERLMWLRQDIMANIQLADNKAHFLMDIYAEVPGMQQLYLEAIAPNTGTPEAPEGYEIFNATEEEHVEYQCRVCREILLKKYSIVNKMVELAKAHMNVDDMIVSLENDIKLVEESFVDTAGKIIFGDEYDSEEGADTDE